jgi:hypothetical protein
VKNDEVLHSIKENTYNRKKEGQLDRSYLPSKTRCCRKDKRREISEGKMRKKM